MIRKKEVVQAIAIFIIELMIFLPFYVADVFAAEPIISNVQASQSFNSATITWQTDIASNSIVNYGKDNLVELSKTDSGTETSHSLTLSPLTPNTKYYFRAKSCDGSQCGSSSISDFMTETAPAPSKINGLSNGSITKTTIEISWNETDTPYFGRYNLYRNNNLAANITSKGTTAFSDINLAPGTQYQYEVSAVNSDGVEGPKSDALILTTIAPDLTAPKIQNISISSLSINSATISWITDEESNSTVNYGYSASALAMVQSSPNYELQHSVALNNLKNNTPHFCKVISCDHDGNCAEQNCPRQFIPSEIKSLDIQLTVPTIYNKPSVPISGTATPNTDVKFMVNGVYKALFSMERNKKGDFNMSVPGFTSGDNKITAIVEDSVGNKKESQTYPVKIDLSPPILKVKPLPAHVSGRSLIVEGSVNEVSTINVYIKLSQAQDSFAPAKVTNFHVDKAEQNSVTLAWTEINETDFSEYIIYRNDVPIATAVSSPYTDEDMVSSDKSYRYEIAAVDLNCNIGPKSVVNAKTEKGGVSYDEDPEQESIHCINSESVPKYTLSSQKNNFREDIQLEQGLNEVIIEAVDEAGNSARQTFKVYYDSEAPEILETNLDTLSPSYIRDVTITGTVSEDSYVCVYINSEPETRHYRKEEVNETANFSGSKFCANSQNKTFSIDIELERNPDYAYDEENPTTQTRSMFLSTADAWTNNIKIIATDSVGLKSDPVEGEIIYALCGNSGDWSVLVEDVMPTEIVPRHLIEGMAQIGISLDLQWRGSGEKPGITDVDVRDGYPMGMSSQLEEKFDTDWISQLTDPTCSDEFDKCYIMIDLKAQDIPSEDNITMYEKEKNLSQHHKGQCFNVPFSKKEQSYIKSAGCVRIPLTFEVNYEKERLFRNNKGVYETRKETFTQKECITVEVLIEPRIPPDYIPNSLLKAAVKFLNATINAIDAILEPLEKVLKATMIACFAMWVVLYAKKVSEGFSCFGKDIFKKGTSCKCKVTDIGIECTKNDGSSDDECKSCVEAKISTKNFEKAMHWVCDRIMCPAVPSYEKYVRDNSQPTSNSNCVGVTVDYDSEKQKNDNPAKCNNAVKGLVNKDGTPIFSDPECCDEEYVTEWRSGCIMMNPLEESHKIAHPEEEGAWSKFWRTVSTFKLCRPGNEDERQVNIEGQWFIFKENEAYKNSKDDKEKEKMFKYDVWSGASVRERTLSNGQILNDTENIVPKEQLTGKKILITDCKKYNIDSGYKYPNGVFWPKYTKTIATETTTTGSEVPATLTKDQMNNPNFDNKTNILTAPDGTKYSYGYVSDQGPTQNLNVVTVESSGKNQKFEVKDGLVFITKSTQSQNKELTAPVPESIVREACSGMSEQYVVDPTDSIFRSIQCVCLSALYSYLKMYRKILGLIKDCFQTILITGDGSSGVCQAVLSYYVCDLLYYMFSCFKGWTGFGTKEASGSATLDFLKGIVGAGAEVQQSVQDRYGDTNMFKVMFADKKIIHAACMLFFGIDADIDLAAMAEQTITMPIKSTISIFPANRRFVGFNPVDGITNHIYQVGLMIVSGSDDMRYNAYLVCSTDNRCDTRYFEKGMCDCSHNGKEITKDITNEFGGNGLLNNGDILNQEAYIPISYSTADARVRYDKVRVEYDFMDNKGGVKKEKVERELSQIGSAPLASCSFDLIGGVFRCGAFTEPTTACLLDDPTIEFKDKDRNFVDFENNKIYNAQDGYLIFKVNARRETTTGDKSKTFYATLKIMDGAKELQSVDQVIDSEDEQEYVFGSSNSTKIKSTWFGGTSSGSGSCSLQINELGLSSIDNCKKDAEIICTKKSETEINFEVHEGTYNKDSFQSDDTNPIKCIAKSTQKSVTCGDYLIRYSNFDSLLSKCDGTKLTQVDKQDSSSSSDSSAESKALTYTITIYRPQSDSPRSKSETIAKCNGQLQQHEGGFTIYADANPKAESGSASASASASSQTAKPADKTKPKVEEFKINNCDISQGGNCVGPIAVSQTATILVTAKITDPIDASSGTQPSGLKNTRLMIKNSDGRLLPTGPVVIEQNPTNFDHDFDVGNVPQGVYSAYLEVTDNSNNIAKEGDVPVMAQIWFGQKCTDNDAGVCIIGTNKCDAYKWIDAAQGTCPSQLKCCQKS